MSRSKKAKIRKVQPDARFNSVLVTKLINRTMLSGKQSVAQSQIYSALELAEAQAKQPALEVLETAVRNITPQMEVRSRRVGGAAYQVPVPVRSNRGSSLALRWLVAEARKRSNREFHSFAQKLAAEIMDALQETGGAVQKKVNAHKMAEANKAFAHFRW